MSTHGTSTIVALPGLSHPQGVTVAGGVEYISDTGGNTVRALDLTSGAISLVAGDGTPGYSGDGGVATAAELASPDGLAVTNGVLYIADQNSSVVRGVDLSSGLIETVAGNGTVGYSGDGGQAAAAQLADPQALAANGNMLYIADLENHVIRSVDLTSGVIETVAGDGTSGYSGDGGAAAAAQLYYPQGVAVSPDGSLLYIADTFNNVVRSVDLTSGVIKTVAGNGGAGYNGDGGAATAAMLNSPSDVVVSPDGNTLYITDTYNSTVRVVDLVGGTISSLSFSGDQSTLKLPYGLAISGDGATVYIADTGDSQVVSVALG
jgi:sugar lactone lactonase YvrE